MQSNYHKIQSIIVNDLLYLYSLTQGMTMIINDLTV